MTPQDTATHSLASFGSAQEYNHRTDVVASVAPCLEKVWAAAGIDEVLHDLGGHFARDQPLAHVVDSILGRLQLEDTVAAE
mmetsp:Transcript_52042/g.120970  ORF Transcript_52042/g.120970 Transcript_52042/m.120970 type:complete len:81 (-) Transcript_52042:851-1093(-)